MIDLLSGKFKKYFAESALLVVTILWGATFVIIKSALDDTSAMMFIAIRFGIAGLLLAPVFFLKYKLFTKDSVKAGLFLGMILFISFAAQTTGLKFTSATKSGFITGSVVVMIPFLQYFIKKKKPTKGAILGAGLVFIGIMFLASGGSSITNFISDLTENFGVGEILTLICALFFALYVVYLDILSSKFEFWVLLSLQIVTTSALGFLAAYFFTIGGIEKVYMHFTPNLIGALIYTSVFATIITTAIQTKMQKEVTPTKAGIIYSFEPIFAALFAFFLISEKISNFGYVGCVLIFAGLIFSEVYESLKKENG
ncbi:MAG: DMT family transporter [Bacteroidetes bacterium]|nr:DMT family transporter [Bacteroidota bacterium]